MEKNSLSHQGPPLDPTMTNSNSLRIQQAVLIINDFVCLVGWFYSMVVEVRVEVMLSFVAIIQFLKIRYFLHSCRRPVSLHSHALE